MNHEVVCVRCARTAVALENPPVPGAVGKEIQQKICPTCWSEWQRAEVMVINELRLNFMDPKAQDVLTHHMREFLMLEGGRESPSAS